MPSVTIITSGFLAMAGAIKRAMKAPDLVIAEYPGVIPMDSPEALADKVRNNVLPAILRALATEVGASAADAAEPGARDTVFRGSYTGVQEYFDGREWSDGLPIVPPTRERVAEFLGWTERGPDEVIGILAPGFRAATVWSVAVNGVMAGCRPEYMPVLLAAAEAVAERDFRLEDAGSTPGWEPLVVVSGDIVQALGFNTEAGNMRVGRRANSSIGRFMRLFFRNVAGLLPGETDKGSIGLTFNVAMGENEQAVRDIGWQPYRVDQGFAETDSVVTVRSVLAVSMPVYSGGTDPVTLARPLARYMAGSIGPFGFTALLFSRWHPLIQMTPAVARGFADLGWGKQDIRNYIFENTKISARWYEHYPFHVLGAEAPLQDLVDRGVIPPSYTASNDPDRLIPMMMKPEWTDIVIAGDPHRNQSRIYINNHEQGAPVTKKIRLPADWRERLAAVSPH